MSGHAPTLKPYFLVFFALLILTAVTVGAAFLDLGTFNTPVALFIASLKAALVLLFFMHLRHSEKAIWVFMITALFWIALLIGSVVVDFWVRGWIKVDAF